MSFQFPRYKRLTNRYHFPDSYVMMNESTLKNHRSQIVITYFIVFYLFSWLCSIAAPTIHHLCFMMTTYYSYVIQVSCSNEFIILCLYYYKLYVILNKRPLDAFQLYDIWLCLYEIIHLTEYIVNTLTRFATTRP